MFVDPVSLPAIGDNVHRVAAGLTQFNVVYDPLPCHNWTANGPAARCWAFGNACWLLLSRPKESDH